MSAGGGHGGGDSGRWLISYADLITLMMALFLVLYTMGQTDVQRYKELAEAFRKALNGGGLASIVDPGINKTNAPGKTDSAPDPVGDQGFPQRPSDTLDVASNLTSLLNQSNLASSISVQNNVEGVLLSLSENLLFQPGEAELQSSAYPLLDKIATMLAKIENDVRVTAYTDANPPADAGRYPTNWELSSARAAAIVRYLSAHGVNPKRLWAAGRSEYHLLFAGDTPEQQAYNRRAEIAVIYTVEEQKFVIAEDRLDPTIDLKSALPGDGAIEEGKTQP
jgi:chemotaxis protein MotB